MWSRAGCWTRWSMPSLPFADVPADIASARPSSTPTRATSIRACRRPLRKRRIGARIAGKGTKRQSGWADAAGSSSAPSRVFALNERRAYIQHRRHTLAAALITLRFYERWFYQALLVAARSVAPAMHRSVSDSARSWGRRDASRLAGFRPVRRGGARCGASYRECTMHPLIMVPLVVRASYGLSITHIRPLRLRQAQDLF